MKNRPQINNNLPKIAVLVGLFLFILLYASRFLSAGQLNLDSISIIAAYYHDAPPDELQIRDKEIGSSFQARALAQIDPAHAEQYLQQHIDDPLSAFALCQYYWELGQRELAANTCRAAEIDGRYWIKLGLEQNQNSQTAQDYYWMAAYSDPTLADGWLRLASSYFRQENYQKSIEAYEYLFSLAGEKKPNWYLSLSRAYMRNNQVDQGRQLLEEGIELFPDQANLYLDLGQLYLGNGDWNLAEYWYDQLLQWVPDDGRGWLARGHLAAQQEDYESAYFYFQQATRIMPDKVSPWSELALAAEKLNNLEVAINAYEKTLALDPDNHNLWFQAGEFYLRNNQTKKAEDAFNQVLLLKPDYQPAIDRLAELSQ